MKKMLKRAAFLFLSIIVALTAAGGLSAFAEEGQAPGRAARTILLYCSGHEMESPSMGLVTKGLNRTMQNEIPGEVNVIVLTGGAMFWNESLRLDGEEKSTRTAIRSGKWKGRTTAVTAC